MATKENKPVRKAIKPLEPPAKRRKLSPPPVADAPVATPEPSQPPATQAEGQPQPHTLSQPSLSQPSSQQKSSFADVLARLKETASEGRGTWVMSSSCTAMFSVLQNDVHQNKLAISRSAPDVA